MKPILFMPFAGALAGYFGSQLAGITDSLARFLIAVGCMILAVIGGFFLSRRSRS